MSAQDVARAESRTSLQREREAGISLVELLVSMLLLGIVLAMITGLYISASKTVTRSKSLHESTSVASNMVNELSRVIRVGVTNPRSGSTEGDPAIIAASRESLTLYAAVDVDANSSISVRPMKPSMVRFDVNGTRQLVETRWLPTPSGQFWVFGDPATMTVASTRNLGGNVAASASGVPLFVYRDTTGAEVVPPSAGPMPLAQRKMIAEVVITVSVTPESGTVEDPVILSNVVELINLGLKGVS